MVQKITHRQVRLKLLWGLLFLPLLVLLPRLAFAHSAFSVNITVPVESFDFSDLDRRDEFNRPIKTSQNSQLIAHLVSSRLFHSLLNNLTPFNEKIRQILEKNWDVFSGWLSTLTTKFLGKVSGWLSSSPKLRFHLKIFKNTPTRYPPISTMFVQNQNFLFLISSLLSSTQILR